jgi:6-phosphofructokinase 2
VYVTGGPLGDMLEDLLTGEGLDHRSIRIRDLTRENLIVYEKGTGQQYRFGMPGPRIRETEWQGVFETLQELDPEPDYLVASGSLPPGVPEDFFARTAGFAKRRGIRLIVDTSGEAFRRAVDEEGVFLIKPNLAELQTLAGRELEEEDDQIGFAGRLLEEGKCGAVVLSLGAAGALLVWSEGHRRLRAPTVQIRSKVGAGDSMVAGIVLGLARGSSLPEAARFGVAAGAAAVMTPGTELCRKEDAERLYENIA